MKIIIENRQLRPSFFFFFSVGLRQENLQKISKGFLVVSLFKRKKIKEISVVLLISRYLEKIILPMLPQSQGQFCPHHGLRELQGHLANCAVIQSLTASVVFSKNLPVIKPEGDSFSQGNAQAHVCTHTLILQALNPPLILQIGQY